MASIGGRAAHVEKQTWQSGASACMSAVGIGSVLRDFASDGTLFSQRGIFVCRAACENPCFGVFVGLHGGVGEFAPGHGDGA